MRKPLLAGNWKMFKNLDDAKSFARDFSKAVADVSERDILICPPSLYLSPLNDFLVGTNVKLGAQDIFWEDEGAFTGEISAGMAKSTGVAYSLVGHSERRQYFGETDETVNRRIGACLDNGLLPVVCVGESLDEREAKKTFEVISTQIKNGLAGLTKDQAEKITIAYEPVWAIGTGKTATPEIAQEVHEYIRKLILEIFGSDVSDNMRILYGGSVKPANVDELMSMNDIDGALVGGASLDPESFERIVRFKG